MRKWGLDSLTTTHCFFYWCFDCLRQLTQNNYLSSLYRRKFYLFFSNKYMNELMNKGRKEEKNNRAFECSTSYHTNAHYKTTPWVILKRTIFITKTDEEIFLCGCFRPSLTDKRLFTHIVYYPQIRIDSEIRTTPADSTQKPSKSSTWYLHHSRRTVNLFCHPSGVWRLMEVIMHVVCLC